MSNSAWCNLNAKGDVLKLHDMCSNPRRQGENQITVTPGQDQFGRAEIKNRLQKGFKGIQATWKKFSKPAINATAPVIGMALAAI